MGRIAFLNAKVLPVEGEDFYGGVIIDGNRIAFMGSNDDVKEYMSGYYHVIDVGGMIIMPGFIDAHIHPLGLILQAINVDLSSARSISEVIELLQKRAGVVKKGDWIIGRGWDDTLFTDEKRYPDKEKLDRLFPDNPVMVVRVCGHVAIVNTPAIDYLSRFIPAYDMDVDYRAGVLRESALESAWDKIPMPSIDTLTEAAKGIFKVFFEKGLTTVVDMGGKEVSLRIYHELGNSSVFPFRVRVYMMPEYLDLMIDTERSSERFLQDVKIVGLKILSDGSLGARTAYLGRPYSDAPDTRGVLNYSLEEMSYMVRVASQHGLQTAIHAIGDGAADISVKAFESVDGISALRPRLEHCQILSKNIVERMLQTGIIASVQPIFVYCDAHWVEERVSKERLAYSYAWKKLKEAGLVVVGGSDSPVCPYDPIKGIISAMTRKTIDGSVFMEEERLDFKDALRMYTVDAAYSIFEENCMGSLKVGKLADIVVLSDIPSETTDSEVVLTMVNGEIVFSSI